MAARDEVDQEAASRVNAGTWMRRNQMIFAISAIGVIAGFTARHPFDYIWNHAARHVLGGPPLPPNPARRRDAFKVGTATNLCGPSETFAWWARRAERKQPLTT
jgi:hypothetical protein